MSAPDLLHRCFGGLLALAVGACLLLSQSSVAQPMSDDADADTTAFVDAVTIGGGLATYRGDLNGGLGTTSMGSILRSGLDLYIAAERRFGATFLAVEGGYSRVRVRDDQFGFSNRILRAEVQGGIGIDWTSPHLVRLYTGIGFLNHRPTLNNPTAVSAEYMTESVGSDQWAVSIPFGVVIDRRVRIGLRWVMDDYLDNAGGDAQAYDFMLHVTIGHRISFNN
jgi:hypothetical protein